MKAQAMLLIVSLAGLVLPTSADELVRLSLSGITYADGGFATGSITLDYPTNGMATVAGFDVTLTDTLLNQPPPIGYGSPTVTMISGLNGIGTNWNWWSYIAGPIGTNNTYQVGIYGGGPEPMEFWFDVPNSLITGLPAVDPVQFDPTAQGGDGWWFLQEDFIEPQDMVTGGTLNPLALGQQPPSLGISMNAAIPTITINGLIGTKYQIEYTTDISATNGWVAFTNVLLQSTSAIIVDSSATSCPLRFYRAAVVQ
jgi:hypothetical protein